MKIPFQKSEEKHVNPCCSSVLVRDSAVQCSETYNSNILAEFNSTHMLNLIKQLQDLVKRKDTGVCEIFTELEQILQKISVSYIRNHLKYCNTAI